jgi:hypothetical protein
MKFHFKARSGAEWDCVIRGQRYRDGQPAWQAYDAEDGAPVATITVNMADYGHIMPEDGSEIFVKNYSENEGILEQLVEQGIVEDTGGRLDAGYAVGGVGVVRPLQHPPFLGS